MLDARAELFQEFLPDQSRKINLGWISLYNWQEEMRKGQVSGLAIKYSKYKYGDFSEVSRFNQELEVLIRDVKGKEIENNPNDWVIFTPPYSSVEPASRALGNGIARMFNIPHIDFRAERGDRQVSYASINDLRMRLQARLAVQTAILNPVAVDGKKALVIDDMMTTGITAVYMEKVLLERYNLGYVFGFCLIDLATENPGYEETINRLLVSSGDLETLIFILNDPRTSINRHTLKSLYGEDKGVLDFIIPRLLSSVVERLEEARDKYFLGRAT